MHQTQEKYGLCRKFKRYERKIIDHILEHNKIIFIMTSNTKDFEQFFVFVLTSTFVEAKSITYRTYIHRQGTHNLVDPFYAKETPIGPISYPATRKIPATPHGQDDKTAGNNSPPRIRTAHHTTQNFYNHYITHLQHICYMLYTYTDIGTRYNTPCFITQGHIKTV